MNAAVIQTRKIRCPELPEFQSEPDLYGDESPLYRATHAIVKQFAESAPAESTVLEIGCGSWDLCKRMCEQRGVRWFGVDPLVSEKNKHVVATHRGSVHDLPFQDAFFDVVIGNQTMEHWHEFGVSFAEGLKEIWRVLRPGGVMIMNVPIHLHGHRFFLLDSRQEIAQLFESQAWKKVTFEEWRYEELGQYFGWKRCRFSEQVFPQLEGHSSFVLNIVAEKGDLQPQSRTKYWQPFKRAMLLSLRATKSTRLLGYHIHYGFRHCANKLRHVCFQ